MTDLHPTIVIPPRMWRKIPGSSHHLTLSQYTVQNRLHGRQLPEQPCTMAASGRC